MTGQRIESLFAFVLDDDDGNEGIAVLTGGRATLPLVAAEGGLDVLWPYARSIAAANATAIRLVEFSAPRVVITYDPTNPK